MRSPSLRLPQGPWVPLLVVILVGSVVMSLVTSQFLTTFNIYVILSEAALLALVGLSQLTVLSVGEFSLAVGGIGGLTGVVVGYLLVNDVMALGPALIIGLALGAAAGLANGVLVAKSGVNGFVITLATGGAFAGISLAITHSDLYTDFSRTLDRFGAGKWGFFPYILVATILISLALGALYRWHRVGRMMLAVGGNAEAAELSGLSPARAIIWAHLLSGLLAAGAGIMAAAKLHQIDPTTGAEWLITSFAVAIIGGTALTGGSISITGVLVASIILATINNSLILLEVNRFWVTLVEGLLVFVAVVLGRGGNFDLLRNLVGRGAPRRPAAE